MTAAEWGRLGAISIVLLALIALSFAIVLALN